MRCSRKIKAQHYLGDRKKCFNGQPEFIESALPIKA